MTKQHLKYQQHLSQILKGLETLQTDILSITTEKKKTTQYSRYKRRTTNEKVPSTPK